MPARRRNDPRAANQIGIATAEVSNRLRALDRARSAFAGADAHDVREVEEKGKVYVIFKIHEGVRYQVRNIEVQGNAVVPRDALLAKQQLKPRDMFNARFLRKDVEHMKGKYDDYTKRVRRWL